MPTPKQAPFLLSLPTAALRRHIVLAVLMSGAASSYAAEDASLNGSAQPLQLAPLVVTAVQQSSPLIIIADPKDARQPVPASDAT
ncbi:MAG: TonB-dependent copper receptor, partial [Halopseudomonas sp.]